MKETYDLIIAGSGVAGLYAALCAPPEFSVLIISKDEAEISNSALAQGGIAASLDCTEENFEEHIRDTMVAGGGTNNPESVNVLVREGPEEVLNLVKLGVEFDTDMLGRLHLTLEGGHSRSRIVHHRDTTGFEVVTKLIARIRERANIDFLENSAMLRLECAPGGGFYAGVLHGGALHGISARSCILATGGVGRIYEFTTNSRIATGDGIRFAGELGARVKNLSLIQFHPTAFDARLAQQERFLISEAVRGEGGLLLNCRGERFMPGYDKRAELAPRDVVSDCIRRETIKTGSSDIFLDISFKDADFLRDRFPSIYSKCLEAGVDITKDRIPVFPCQHYLMGGIDVDTFARTTVPGLYAVGECSHTGVHGNNRLASNSLLEALVFPRRALRDIVSAPQRPLPAPKPMSLCGGAQPPQEFYKTIRSVMQKSFFIIPDPDEARRSLPVIEEIDATLEAGHYAESRETIELKSMARVAKIILKELCER